MAYSDEQIRISLSDVTSPAANEYILALTPEQRTQLGIKPATRYIPGTGIVQRPGQWEGAGAYAVQALEMLYGSDFLTTTKGAGVTPLLPLLTGEIAGLMNAPRARLTYNPATKEVGSSGSQSYDEAQRNLRSMLDDLGGLAGNIMGGTPHTPTDLEWRANYYAVQQGYRDARDLVQYDIDYRRNPQSATNTQTTQTPALPGQIPDSDLLLRLSKQLAQPQTPSDSLAASSLLTSAPQETGYQALLLDRLSRGVTNQPGAPVRRQETTQQRGMF